MAKNEKTNAAVKAQGKKSEKAATEKKNTKNQNKKPNIFQRFVQYLKDVRVELHRVVWPSRKELISASLVVVGALIFFGVFIYIVDSVITPALIAFDGLV
jgi:preprotein translocase subunit SecE